MVVGNTLKMEDFFLFLYSPRVRIYITTLGVGESLESVLCVVVLMSGLASRLVTTEDAISVPGDVSRAQRWAH